MNTPHASSRSLFSPRMNRAACVLTSAILAASLLSACSDKKSRSGTKEMEKQQPNLMDAMDKIAADEAKKKEAEKSPESPAATDPAPAPAAPPSDAPQPKPVNPPK